MAPMSDQDHTSPPASVFSTRVDSIDIYRGLTIFLMIFVNEFGGPGMADIVNAPSWLWHAMKPDTFHFADIIAPAFLFIMGVSLPFAVNKRLEKGDSLGQVWKHTLIRTGSLMIIGISMGNMRAGRLIMRPIGFSPMLWSTLLMLSLILAWIQYPKAKGFWKYVFTVLRFGGLVLLAYLLVVYREGPDLKGIQLRWFVLGLLGWAYLIAFIAYLALKRYPAGMVGLISVLFFLSIGEKAGVFAPYPLLMAINKYINFGWVIGLHPAMTVSGVFVGLLFMPGSPAPTVRERIKWMLVFAAGLLAGGILTRPLYGAYKQQMTPSWGLYSVAISVAIFAFVYWLVDVRKIKAWGAMFRPVGKNPLLPYFLHYMFHPLLFVLGLHWLNNYFHEGWPGAIRVLIVTTLFILFSNWLTTRYKLILKL
jgi:heparan-alpha-glucosaminide N-acetyltransferase